ncbi:MAG: DUF937 domain-containing protein [Saprospiraceae bacterium]|nr:hypothetical protein [Lewinella sp.]
MIHKILKKQTSSKKIRLLGGVLDNSNPEQIKAATPGLLAVLSVSLVGKATTKEGAVQLSNTLANKQPSGQDNADMIKSLLGNHQDKVYEIIGNESGMGIKDVSRLTSLLTTDFLQELADVKKKKNLNINDLAILLKQTSQNIPLSGPMTEIVNHIETFHTSGQQIGGNMGIAGFKDGIHSQPDDDNASGNIVIGRPGGVKDVDTSNDQSPPTGGGIPGKVGGFGGFK